MSERKAQLPLVSVVIPSFEQGRFLRAALRSLVGQDYPRVEILVQDNCSTDRTAEVLGEFETKIDSIRVERDGGQSDALRRGFERARGEILTWLNADDLLMPDAIANAVEAFTASDTPDVVYGHCAHVEESGTFQRYFYEVQDYSASLLRNVADFISQPGTFFSRDAYDAVGGLDGDLHYAMDWDLWCRFARGGLRFRRLDEVMAAARFYPATKTSSGGLSRVREILSVNRRYQTDRLPWGAMSHLYGDVIRPRFGGFDGLARWIYRRVGPGYRLNRTVVNGLRDRNVVSNPDFLISFPVCVPIFGVEMRLERNPEGTPIQFSASLVANGISHSAEAVAGSAKWNFPASIIPKAIGIRCRIDESVLRGGEVRVADVRLQLQRESL